MSFSLFIRKTTKPTTTPVGRVYSEETLNNVRISAGIEPLLDVIRDPLENYCRLVSSFTWSTTPQGSGYWSFRNRGVEPISEDDLSFLRQLRDYYRIVHGYEF